MMRNLRVAKGAAKVCPRSILSAGHLAIALSEQNELAEQLREIVRLERLADFVVPQRQPTPKFVYTRVSIS